MRERVTLIKVSGIYRADAILRTDRVPRCWLVGGGVRGGLKIEVLP
jgi:hypothetical protein